MRGTRDKCKQRAFLKLFVGPATIVQAGFLCSLIMALFDRDLLTMAIWFCVHFRHSFGSDFSCSSCNFTFVLVVVCLWSFGVFRLIGFARS